MVFLQQSFDVLMLQTTADRSNPKDIFTRPIKIGEGKFGKVFRAQNRKTDEVIAVKKLDMATCDSRIEANCQEVLLLKQLNHHNILSYKHHYIHEKYLWIVTEYIDGINLQDLADAFTLQDHVIGTIAREVLQGLNYLHQRQIVHRDVKSLNVMVSKDTVKLVDFGFARKEDDIDPDVMVGSYYHMAPEVMAMKNYGCKADIWSFGCMIVQMKTGEAPLAGEGLKFEYVKNLIITYGKPEIQGENNWSFLFRSFLSKSMRLSPENRGTAKTLLGHRFLKNTAPMSDVTKLIARYNDMTKK